MNSDTIFSKKGSNLNNNDNEQSLNNRKIDSNNNNQNNQLLGGIALTRIIYVPQGRSARLTNNNPLSCQVLGLYTDGFSTCNIIAAIGEKKDKACLIHCDSLTNLKRVQSELEWVEPQKVYLLYQKAYSEALTPTLREFLSQQFSSSFFEEKELQEEQNGIYVTLSCLDKSAFHSHIDFREKSTLAASTLFHHPLEQKFTAVRKIQQVIGIHQARKVNRRKDTQLCIFDGLFWERIQENELLLQPKNDECLTQEEINCFKAKDNYMTIAGKLLGLIGATEKGIGVFGNSKEIAGSVAIYLEGYLNDFNPSFLLTRNLRDLLTPNPKDDSQSIFNDKTLQLTDQDHQICEQLQPLLKQENAILKGIRDLMESYKNTAPDSSFKKILIKEYNEFIQHYQERSAYREQNIQTRDLTKKVSNFIQRGVRKSQGKEYDSALNLFNEALNHGILILQKNDKLLSDTFFNIGRTLFQASKNQEAIFYLETAFSLLGNQTSPSQSDIQKFTLAIEENQKALNNDSSEVKLGLG